MLRVEMISKEFPGVKALSDVSLAFEPGRSTRSSARTAPARAR